LTKKFDAVWMDRSLGPFKDAVAAAKAAQVLVISDRKVVRTGKGYVSTTAEGEEAPCLDYETAGLPC
jgi:hypothetical protein